MQDQAVAEAWGQPAWADYSGVSRTLQSLNDEEVNALVDALTISQPTLHQIKNANKLLAICWADWSTMRTSPVVQCQTRVRPIRIHRHSATWVTTVSLGYQAALVSLHSPTFGRLWPANQLHPGDTVSVNTGTSPGHERLKHEPAYRPRRRTELVANSFGSRQKATVVAAEEVI